MEGSGVKQQNQKPVQGGLEGTGRGSDGKWWDFLGKGIHCRHRGLLHIGNCLRREARCQPSCGDWGSRGDV